MRPRVYDPNAAGFARGARRSYIARYDVCVWGCTPHRGYNMPKDNSAQERADAIASAVASASDWATLARALDVPGKRLRDVVRGVFGEYKSRGGAFDVRTRSFVAAYFAEGVTSETRATLKRNYHAGNAVEDMLAAAPSGE